MKTIFYFLGSKIYASRYDCHVVIDFSINSMTMHVGVYTNENSEYEPYNDFEWINYDFTVKEFRVYSPNDVRVRFADKTNQKNFVDLMNKYYTEFRPISPETGEYL